MADEIVRDLACMGTGSILVGKPELEATKKT
jgi:hypothetical protein